MKVLLLIIFLIPIIIFQGILLLDTIKNAYASSKKQKRPNMQRNRKVNSHRDQENNNRRFRAAK